MTQCFNAMVITDTDKGQQADLRAMTLDQLDDLDVLVEVAFSTINYKDGMALTGRNRIARRSPLIGGIDLAGTVIESRNPEWKSGDRVTVNGWGLSERFHGGYAQKQRVKAEWLVRIPEVFSLQDAAAIGTAGYTAALCVDALVKWGALAPQSEVLVTGAAGGVGSVAISLLAALGMKVTASTGRPQTHAYLRSLGATDFVDRAELDAAGAPAQTERWAGVVDSVGSTTLVNALAQTVRGGAVSACGLAGGADLNGTVIPFILRGVALLGIDSVLAPMEKRLSAWSRLAADLDPAKLALMTRVEPMSRLPELAEDILAGRIQGRVVIDVNA